MKVLVALSLTPGQGPRCREVPPCWAAGPVNHSWAAQRVPANCPHVIAMVISKCSADVCLLQKQKGRKKEQRERGRKKQSFKFSLPTVTPQLLKSLDGGRAEVADLVLDRDGPSRLWWKKPGWPCCAHRDTLSTASDKWAGMCPGHVHSSWTGFASVFPEQGNILKSCAQPCDISSMPWCLCREFS